jgi:hypothetical protein
VAGRVESVAHRFQDQGESTRCSDPANEPPPRT